MLYDWDKKRKHDEGLKFYYSVSMKRRKKFNQHVIDLSSLPHKAKMYSLTKSNY